MHKRNYKSRRLFGFLNNIVPPQHLSHTGHDFWLNFPVVERFSGVKVCRMARGTWGNEVVRCHHPRGYDYYWMVGKYRNEDPDDEATDNWALRHGYVAITPTRMDVTSNETIQQIKDWNLS